MRPWSFAQSRRRRRNTSLGERDGSPTRGDMGLRARVPGHYVVHFSATKSCTFWPLCLALHGRCV
eukprot:4044366-Pleurochrysis_carterae.AAC.1